MKRSTNPDTLVCVCCEFYLFVKLSCTVMAIGFDLAS